MNKVLLFLGIVLILTSISAGINSLDKKDTQKQDPYIEYRNNILDLEELEEIDFSYDYEYDNYE